MAFRTKLDFSSNRQVKQHEKTITVLSGSTSFGLPFSAMTSGPDLSTSSITQTISSITSTFSGNSGTTNYTWYDTRMSLGESVLSAITPSISGITQITGPIFSSNTSTIIDNNNVVLSYSGVDYNITVTAMDDLGGGSYSGTILTTLLFILSANALDYTGRTIWNDVSGITRTERLIITDNPISGYVWTCIDSEGMGGWQYNGSSSAATIWTAGTGVSSAVLGGSGGIASGITSISEGTETFAIGDYSHAEGLYTSATTVASHAEGYASVSSGQYSHAEGWGTIASDYGAHSEGRDTIASGYTSHAEGWGSVASEFAAHAEGYFSLASGLGSHAEGGDVYYGNSGGTASGRASHAEGAGTKATGDYSHAEGNNTIASGDNSHSGGYYSSALGLYSFTHGNNVVASSQSTIVLGENLTGSTASTLYTNNLNIDNQDNLFTSKLGVNTSSPLYPLDVHGSSISRMYYSPTSPIGGSFFISATTGLPFIGAATNSGVINQNGTISIGMRAWDDVTYTAYGKQGDTHLYSSKQANGLLLISSDGTGTEDYIECYVGGDASGGELAIHMHGTGATKGYVGFKTNSPTQRLDVDGNGRFRSIGSSASAGALHYTADGTLTTNTSDERLKTNILTLNNALDKVKQLRGVTYNWTENPTGDTRIGFIAQEVNNIIPELTFINPNSEEQYMGVHYDNVTALLVEAIKELSYGVTIPNNTYLETQTILAEDNNIDLNYSGTPETAVGGGIRVLHALGNDNAAELVTDSEGNFITNNDFKPKALTIPLYTPTSSSDVSGSEGNITRDDNYLYLKSSSGWKRTNLELF